MSEAFNAGTLAGLIKTAEEGRAPTDTDRTKIRDYVRAHPGLSDAKFHDYAKGLGVNVHRAEEFVYGQARALAGGRAEEKGARKPDPRQLAMGRRVESEHTHRPEVAREIARDHLAEIPDYYTRLRAMEAGAKTAAAMPHFTQQDRPETVKKIYRALKREHPRMPAEMKARIAARQGKPGKQHQGPPYKGPLTRE